MVFAAKRLMDYTREKRPDLYEAILKKIQPHSLDAVLYIIECHLRQYDLNSFNKNLPAVPEFMYKVIKCFRFPTPGDAFGIQIACRTTKSDTQGALDSKHLSSLTESKTEYNAEKNILHELALFSNQKQVFELSNKRRYSTVYTNYSIEELMKLLPEACYLERGFPRNKGKNLNGEFKYLSTFKYIIVKDRGSVKILYQLLKDLYNMLRRISPRKIVAFSDVRCLFQKCGIVSHFFNMVRIVERQLFINDGSTYEKDVLTLIKYQCRSGTPLPLTRDGLAKNPARTIMDILSFEAPKKNLAIFSTGESKNVWFRLTSSADKIFSGEQFIEGVGYLFKIISNYQESHVLKFDANYLDFINCDSESSEDSEE